MEESRVGKIPKKIKICGTLDLLRGINEQAKSIVVYACPAEGVDKDSVALLFGFTTLIYAYCSSDWYTRE